MEHNSEVTNDDQIGHTSPINHVEPNTQNTTLTSPESDYLDNDNFRSDTIENTMAECMFSNNPTFHPVDQIINFQSEDQNFISPTITENSNLTHDDDSYTLSFGEKQEDLSKEEFTDNNKSDIHFKNGYDEAPSSAPFFKELYLDLTEANELLDPNFTINNWKKKIFVNGFHFDSFFKSTKRKPLFMKLDKETNHQMTTRVNHKPIPGTRAITLNQGLRLDHHSEEFEKYIVANMIAPSNSPTDFDFNWIKDIDFDELEKKVDNRLKKNSRLTEPNNQSNERKSLDRISYSIKDENGIRQTYNAEAFSGGPTIFYKDDKFYDLNKWLTFLKSSTNNPFDSDIGNIQLDKTNEYHFGSQDPFNMGVIEPGQEIDQEPVYSKPEPTSDEFNTLYGHDVDDDFSFSDNPFASKDPIVDLFNGFQNSETINDITFDDHNFNPKADNYKTDYADKEFDFQFDDELKNDIHPDFDDLTNDKIMCQK